MYELGKTYIFTSKEDRLYAAHSACKAGFVVRFKTDGGYYKFTTEKPEGKITEDGFDINSEELKMAFDILYKELDLNKEELKVLEKIKTVQEDVINRLALQTYEFKEE